MQLLWATLVTGHRCVKKQSCDVRLLWEQVHAELLDFVKVKFENAERAAMLAGQPVIPSSVHVQQLQRIASRLRNTVNGDVKPLLLHSKQIQGCHARHLQKPHTIMLHDSCRKTPHAPHQADALPHHSLDRATQYDDCSQMPSICTCNMVCKLKSCLQVYHLVLRAAAVRLLCCYCVAPSILCVRLRFPLSSPCYRVYDGG